MRTPQINRLLNLVPYLQNRRTVTVARVAEDFGITPKQVLADLEVLQFCGLPDGYHDDLFDVDIEGARTDGYILFRNADVLRRPRKLRVEEATSLLVALELMLETSPGSEAAHSAMAKLRDVLGDVQPAVSVSVSGGEAEVTSTLQRAVGERAVVDVVHRGRSGTRRHRVEPAQLRTVDGFVYLDAWNRERQGWRSYRLDRIESADAVGEHFVGRDDVPDATRPWFEDARDLTLELDLRAAWVAEYFPTTADTTADDHISITFPVGSRSWAVGLVLRLGPLVRGVSDPGVAAAARAEALAALDNYDLPG